MANVTVAGQNYTGVNSVELPKTGEAARQKFIIPTGTVNIAANGTVDVSQYEEASVNVPAPEPNLQQKTATPTETAQEITPDSGYDGLAKVTVEAVSATYVGSGVARKAAEIITPGTADQVIDANQYLTGEQTIRGDGDLKAGNIRAGVEIFGVTGSYGGEGVNLQEKSATPSTSQQVIQPDSGYDGLSKVTVAGDADLIPGNIKSGAEIFGVAGSYAGEAPVLQEKTATANGEYTPDAGYDGLSKVTVNVETGGAEPVLQEKSIAPTESAQAVTPDVGYDGLSKVNVGAISSTYVGSGITKKAAATITPGAADQVIGAGQYLEGEQTIPGDADLTAENIRAGVEIFGVAGSYSGETPALQEKTVTPAAVQQTVQPDDGYDGLSKVTVAGDANLVAANIKSGVAIFGVEGAYSGNTPNLQEKSITENGTYTPDGGYDGFSSVTVNVPTGGGGLPAEIVAGDTPVMMDGRVVTATSSSWAETAMTITIPKAGTYRFKWIMGDSYSGHTRATRLYKNGVAAGTEHSGNNHGDVYCTDDIECAAGDVMTMYIKGYRNYGNYYGTAGNLVACIDWDNGF